MMTDTPILLDAEHAPHPTRDGDPPILLDMPIAHGILRLVAAPATAPTDDPPTVVTPASPVRAVRRSRAYVASRCYDIGVAMILLLSAGVALYRLIWMGMP